MNEPLSPAALAVIAAYNKETRPEPHHQCEAIAAALQAAADQVVPAEPENEDLDPCNPDDKAEWAQYCQRQHTRSRIRAIAAELEATND